MRVKHLNALLLSATPKITPFGFPNNVTVGQRGTAICTATEGDQPLNFRWLKNGGDLRDAKRNVAVTDNADFSVLKIQSLSLESSGNYTCIVSNLLGSASHSATLTVHGKLTKPTKLTSVRGYASCRDQLFTFFVSLIQLHLNGF